MKPMSTEDWDAQNDLDTLMRASEIAKDGKRMDRARSHARRKALEMARVADSMHENATMEEMMKNGYRKVK